MNKPHYDHQWDRDGERCTVCGDKDWMGGSCRAPSSSDPYAAGYRPAVQVDLAQLRRKAVAAHKAAMSQADTEAYPKPPARKWDWSLVAFLAVMAMIGIGIALAVALVMA